MWAQEILTLYNTAVTKQWTAKCPEIAMLFSELYKNMVKRLTFVGFREGDRPNPPTLVPPLASQHFWRDLLIQEHSYNQETT